MRKEIEEKLKKYKLNVGYKEESDESDGSESNSIDFKLSPNIVKIKPVNTHHTDEWVYASLDESKHASSYPKRRVFNVLIGDAERNVSNNVVRC